MHARVSMKYIIYILISLLLQGCFNLSDNANLNEIEIKIYNEWLYTFKIQDLKVSNEVITRPPGIEQLLFKLLIPNVGGISLKTHCVYYQVPYKEIKGHLRVTELKNDVECTDTPTGESFIFIDSITDLRVEMQNFKLQLDFKQKKAEKKWSFLMPNIANGLIHEKYQAVKERKLLSGLALLRVNEETFDNSTNKYLGKISDRLSRGSAIRCQQVDKNCNDIGENRCDSCKYGWYQVVDYSCPQGGSKFCGQNHCGEKNEPACLRGTKIVEGVDSGICQSDLTPVYSADHILICQ